MHAADGKWRNRLASSSSISVQRNWHRLGQTHGGFPELRALWTPGGNAGLPIGSVELGSPLCTTAGRYRGDASLLPNWW